MSTITTSKSLDPLRVSRCQHPNSVSQSPQPQKPNSLLISENEKNSRAVRPLTRHISSPLILGHSTEHPEHSNSSDTADYSNADNCHVNDEKPNENDRNVPLLANRALYLSSLACEGKTVNVSPDPNDDNESLDTWIPLELEQDLEITNMESLAPLTNYLSTFLYPSIFNPGENVSTIVPSSLPKDVILTTPGHNGGEDTVVVRSMAHFSQMRRWYKSKTTPCSHVTHSDCPYGKLCWFVHTDEQYMKDVLLQSDTRKCVGERLRVFLGL
ncbi:hypothetical protein BLNAU_1397 [Blattamonas nauphoetae]|uniref:C3H1-type domain-containing protein n=1 Tax=Blattamonas nauphoetae TaxID=2049346 RepID=A0ABQ9YJ98_9EUKA|nr:hypothetical protein BLNAU_1397 [Blattamonas nauphoetae]